MHDYLTVDEAAELLRTPVATLHQWSYRRVGPPVAKVGRRLLYNREELLAWVGEQTRTTTAV